MGDSFLLAIRRGRVQKAQKIYARDPDFYSKNILNKEVFKYALKAPYVSKPEFKTFLNSSIDYVLSLDYILYYDYLKHLLTRKSTRTATTILRHLFSENAIVFRRYFDERDNPLYYCRTYEQVELILANKPSSLTPLTPLCNHKEENYEEENYEGENYEEEVGEQELGKIYDFKDYRYLVNRHLVYDSEDLNTENLNAGDVLDADTDLTVEIMKYYLEKKRYGLIYDLRFKFNFYEQNQYGDIFLHYLSPIFPYWEDILITYPNLSIKNDRKISIFRVLYSKNPSMREFLLNNSQIKGGPLIFDINDKNRKGETILFDEYNPDVMNMHQGFHHIDVIFEKMTRIIDLGGDVYLKNKKGTTILNIVPEALKTLLLNYLDIPDVKGAI